MRLVALSIVVLAGAILLAADAIPQSRGPQDEIGTFMVVVGGIALAIELYLVPIGRQVRDRGKD
jgi:hypothetical protein